MCRLHSPSRNDMSRLPRRDFLLRAGAAPLLLGPLASLLAGCGNGGNWPEGMVPIHWDRDTCVRCSMVISDRRFAAQLRGATGTAFKFDDIGCLLFWMQEKASAHPWMAEAATRLWVADFDSPSREAMRWLDPRQAHYVARTSPMGYNFGALASATAEAIGFEEMRQRTLARGK